MPAKPIPDGYHAVTPYLIVDDGAAAIEFYKRAFGARHHVRIDRPDGKVMHAEMKLDDSIIMLADEAPERGAPSPRTLGGTPVGILLYVEDVDVRFQQAVDAGGVVERPVMDQPYGDRSGTLKDPFGHKWTIATHIEDVSVEETIKRYQQGAQ